MTPVGAKGKIAATINRITYNILSILTNSREFFKNGFAIKLLGIGSDRQEGDGWVGCSEEQAVAWTGMKNPRLRQDFGEQAHRPAPMF
jgi:hypothetical protein